ncbi:MAG: hypothetical protein QOE03_1314, partial [Micromonosporaceae bacterium]|nr:hypothetical protein [Micromonosporaceae bacterium]
MAAVTTAVTIVVSLTVASPASATTSGYAQAAAVADYSFPATG